MSGAIANATATFVSGPVATSVISPFFEPRTVSMI